jgi:hypothetical protein
LPATVEEQDSVEVPEPPVTVVEDNAHERFVELVVIANATIPVNPFTGATVIVEVPEAPAFTVTLVALAVTVKSWTWKTTFAEWDRVVPLVPVTVAR